MKISKAHAGGTADKSAILNNIASSNSASSLTSILSRSSSQFHFTSLNGHGGIFSTLTTSTSHTSLMSSTMSHSQSNNDQEEINEEKKSSLRVSRSASSFLNMNEDTMLIHINTIMGNKFDIRCFGTDSIKEVLDQIQLQEGISADNVVLIYKDQSLNIKENKMLCDYDIWDGCQLNLVVKMKGGPGPFTKFKSMRDDDNSIILLCKQEGVYFVIDMMKDGTFTRIPAKQFLEANKIQIDADLIESLNMEGIDAIDISKTLGLSSTALEELANRQASRVEERRRSSVVSNTSLSLHKEERRDSQHSISLASCGYHYPTWFSNRPPSAKSASSSILSKTSTVSIMLGERPMSVLSSKILSSSQDGLVSSACSSRASSARHRSSLSTFIVAETNDVTDDFLDESYVQGVQKISLSSRQRLNEPSRPHTSVSCSTSNNSIKDDLHQRPRTTSSIKSIISSLPVIDHSDKPQDDLDLTIRPSHSIFKPLQSACVTPSLDRLELSKKESLTSFRPLISSQSRCGEPLKHGSKRVVRSSAKSGCAALADATLTKKCFRRDITTFPPASSEYNHPRGGSVERRKFGSKAQLCGVS